MFFLAFFAHSYMIYSFRDLKPANLLLKYNDNGTMTVKICDFGLSRLLSWQDRSMTSGVGSPRYKSPEIRNGSKDYDCKTDVFSAGVIALELYLLKKCPTLYAGNNVTKGGKSFLSILCFCFQQTTWNL